MLFFLGVKPEVEEYLKSMGIKVFNNSCFLDEAYIAQQLAKRYYLKHNLGEYNRPLVDFTLIQEEAMRGKEPSFSKGGYARSRVL